MLTCVKMRSIIKVRNMTHGKETIKLKEWLTKLRLEKDMTQDDVAKNADIPRTTYSSIEQGRRRPSVENAMRIASVLDFEWTLFFENERRELTHKKEMTK